MIIKTVQNLLQIFKIRNASWLIKLKGFLISQLIKADYSNKENCINLKNIL